MWKQFCWDTLKGKLENVLQGAEVSLFLNISAQIGSESDNSAFILVIVCIQASDEKNKALGCMCVKWSTDDGIDHNLESRLA